MKLLSWLDRALASVERVAIVAFVAIAFAIGIVQVILRYCFSSGLEWATYAFVFCTVAAMLVAGSIAVREDRHVSIDYLQEVLPPRGKFTLRLLSDIAALLLSVVYLYCSLRYLEFIRQIVVLSPETGLPEWPFYAVMPITAAMFALRYLIRLYRLLTVTEIQPDSGSVRIGDVFE